jgi:hypothetical protein
MTIEFLKLPYHNPSLYELYVMLRNWFQDMQESGVFNKLVYYSIDYQSLEPSQDEDEDNFFCFGMNLTAFEMCLKEHEIDVKQFLEKFWNHCAYSKLCVVPIIRSDLVLPKELPKQPGWCIIGKDDGSLPTCYDLVRLRRVL